MSTNRKGFFTIDAFFAFLLLVSISGMLLGLAQSHEQVARSSSATLQADMVAEKLAAVINSVYANGIGAENFDVLVKLPDNIWARAIPSPSAITQEKFPCRSKTPWPVR